MVIIYTVYSFSHASHTMKIWTVTALLMLNGSEAYIISAGVCVSSVCMRHDNFN